MSEFEFDGFESPEISDNEAQTESSQPQQNSETNGNTLRTEISTNRENSEKTDNGVGINKEYKESNGAIEKLESGSEKEDTLVVEEDTAQDASDKQEIKPVETREIGKGKPNDSMADVNSEVFIFLLGVESQDLWLYMINV